MNPPVLARRPALDGARSAPNRQGRLQFVRGTRDIGIRLGNHHGVVRPTDPDAFMQFAVYQDFAGLDQLSSLLSGAGQTAKNPTHGRRDCSLLGRLRSTCWSNSTADAS